MRVDTEQIQRLKDDFCHLLAAVSACKLVSRDQTKEVSTKQCCSVPSYGGKGAGICIGRREAREAAGKPSLLAKSASGRLQWLRSESLGGVRVGAVTQGEGQGGVAATYCIDYRVVLCSLTVVVSAIAHRAVPTTTG